MIYLVCEDSGSGYQFWTTALKIFTDYDVRDIDDNSTEVNSNAIFATTSRGNMGLFKTVKSLNLTAQDVLILIYDNIPTDTMYAQIDSITLLKKTIGFAICTSSYYCIEQVFLSYTYLLDFLELNKSSRVIELSKIWRFWISLGASVEGMKYCANKYDNIFSDFGSTLEQKIASFLSQLTALSKLRVQISKSRIGSCWLCDCNESENVYVCDKCSKKDKRLTAKQKLLSLDENSVLHNSDVSFTSLQHYLEGLR